MKMSIIIPVMGQVHETKGIVKLLLALATTAHETLIINNSIDPAQKALWKAFIEAYLKPQNLNYIENPDNIGMVQTMQQGYKKSTGDILAYFHSDVFLYENGWDAKVMKYFEKMPDLGLVGFFGQRGMHGRAGREDCMSNMLEAEIHGRRMTAEYEYVIATDGFSIICRRQMLDKGNGFDQDYEYHHVYDKNIGMDCWDRGYKAICVNMSCHHWSGKSANSPNYQAWINQKMESETGDQETMTRNLNLFDQKWAHCLPVFAKNDGTLSKAIAKNV